MNKELRLTPEEWADAHMEYCKKHNLQFPLAGEHFQIAFGEATVAKVLREFAGESEVLTDEEIWHIQQGNSEWDDEDKGRAVAQAQHLRDSARKVQEVKSK